MLRVRVHVFFLLRVRGARFFFAAGAGGAFFFCCGCRGGAFFFLLRVRSAFAVFSIFCYENLYFLKFSIGKPLSSLYLNRKTSFFSIFEYENLYFLYI